MLMHNFVHELRARAFYNWNDRIKAGLPFEAKRFPCSQNDLTLVDPALKRSTRDCIAVIAHTIQDFLCIKAAVTGSVHPNPKIVVFNTQRIFVFRISAQLLQNISAHKCPCMAKLRAMQKILWLRRGVIDHFSKDTFIIEKAHGAADNTRLRVLGIQCEFLFKPVRCADIIAVHAGNIISACSSQTFVQGCIQSKIFLVSQEGNALIVPLKFTGNLPRFIRRSIIADDKLPVRYRLVLNGGNCLRQSVGAVVCTHNHRNSWIHNPQLLFWKIPAQSSR